MLWGRVVAPRRRHDDHAPAHAAGDRAGATTSSQCLGAHAHVSAVVPAALHHFVKRRRSALWRTYRTPTDRGRGCGPGLVWLARGSQSLLERPQDNLQTCQIEHRESNPLGHGRSKRSCVPSGSTSVRVKLSRDVGHRLRDRQILRPGALLRRGRLCVARGARAIEPPVCADSVAPRPARPSMWTWRMSAHCRSRITVGR